MLGPDMSATVSLSGCARRCIELTRSTMKNDVPDIDMEATVVADTSLRVSRVALGTWAIGGWM
jgi:hypothetical protein